MSVNIREIDVEKLDPNPYQARVEYPEPELRDLGNSIREKGLLEPIIVRPKRDRYEIAVGERRVRACRIAGLEKIPAIVKELSDEQMAEYVLIENLQRQDLNPIEQARGFKPLQERFGWTQEKIANELGPGWTRDIVAQRLRLLSFPVELQELVSHDTITPTHAETLAKLADDPTALKEAVTKVVDQKMTTRQTEQLVSESMVNRDIRKCILDFVTSEQFMLELEYLSDLVYGLGSESSVEQFCPRPSCRSELEFQPGTDERGYAADSFACTACGWVYPIEHGPRLDLLKRIGELHATKEAKTNKTEQLTGK